MAIPVEQFLPTSLQHRQGVNPLPENFPSVQSEEAVAVDTPRMGPTVRVQEIAILSSLWPAMADPTMARALSSFLIH